MLFANCKNFNLKNRTGTEEQITERGSLLQEIQTQIEASKVPINIQLGADDSGDGQEEFNVDIVFDENEVNEVIAETENMTPKTQPKPMTERERADFERNEVLARAECKNLEVNVKLIFIIIMDMNIFLLVIGNLDKAPEADNFRRKRMKLSPEDELIKIKQEHDMDIEVKKMKLQKEMQDNQFVLENRRLELEEKREARIADENRRRDEITIQNIEVQKHLFSIVSALTKAKD